mmetsp:Transcript_65036/g.146031  ORF Transcript_65036/g.146031 Transcript_65036/m.146031 type:complete len:223 (+) Transcript_65036:624-1292(+)
MKIGNRSGAKRLTQSVTQGRREFVMMATMWLREQASSRNSVSASRHSSICRSCSAVSSGMFEDSQGKFQWSNASEVGKSVSSQSRMIIVWVGSAYLQCEDGTELVCDGIGEGPGDTSRSRCVRVAFPALRPSRLRPSQASFERPGESGEHSSSVIARFGKAPSVSMRSSLETLPSKLYPRCRGEGETRPSEDSNACRQMTVSMQLGRLGDSIGNGTIESPRE